MQGVCRARAVLVLWLAVTVSTQLHQSAIYRPSPSPSNHPFNKILSLLRTQQKEPWNPGIRKHSLKFLRAKCPQGYEIKYNYCFMCYPGSYSSDGVACHRCPRDSFNPTPGAASCVPCPFGYHTDGEGARNRYDCKVAVRGPEPEEEEGTFEDRVDLIFTHTQGNGSKAESLIERTPPPTRKPAADLVREEEEEEDFWGTYGKILLLVLLAVFIFIVVFVITFFWCMGAYKMGDVQRDLVESGQGL